MELSVTAITSNRKLGKALIRQSSVLNLMRGCCRSIDTENESFDILQVAFIDKPSSYIECRGVKKGDRLYQVLVGLRPELSFRSEHDRELLLEIANQVIKAIERCSISDRLRQEIIPRIQEWIKEFPQ